LSASASPARSHPAGRDAGVVERAARALDDQHASVLAACRRVLGDQIGGSS
jgi:hypothetical protein